MAHPTDPVKIRADVPADPPLRRPELQVGRAVIPTPGHPSSREKYVPVHRGLTLNDYQQGALTTNGTPDKSWEYHVLGVIGELAEHVKKAVRDDDGELTVERKMALAKELGDAMWYIAVMAHELGMTLEEVGQLNLDKLADRARRGVIKGQGDER